MPIKPYSRGVTQTVPYPSHVGGGQPVLESSADAIVERVHAGRGLGRLKPIRFKSPQASGMADGSLVEDKG